jgi:hypothetical protein
LHVFPVAVRDMQGAWAPRASVLETAVPLVVENTSPREAFARLVTELGKRAGKPATVSEFPELPPARNVLSFRSTGETARDILTLLAEQVARLSGKTSSWQFLYDPRAGGFALRVYHVPSP